ncbi:MAG: hypothetical protein ABIN37_09210 [Burkholderiaceae bacterium]
MASRRWLRPLFWIALAGFIAWDWSYSLAVDVRQEPPAIAAGSGQAVSGGHCSLAR